MPNTTPIFRQRAILAFVKRSPFPSFKEIREHVNLKLEQQFFIDDKTKTGFSKRTFERDLKDISWHYGAEIVYSSKERGYYLDSDIHNSAIDQMLSGFDVLNALKLSKNITPFVLLEDRKPMGTEHLFGLFHAIQSKLAVEFTHQKFWENHPTKRQVFPLAVKEFRYRWYLVAEDQKDNVVKSFGLDRISDLHVRKEHFKLNKEVKIIEKYKHAFGVIGSHEQEPTLVKLKLSPSQGKYVKSLPFHSSQKVLIDNEHETCISLLIYPTYDFIMELLSLGKEAQVLEPKWLVEEMKKRLTDALKNYV